MNSRFIHTLQRFFSDKRVTIAIIGIAIGARLLQLIYFYTIGFDISYQVIAMHNLSVGNGITVDTVNPADVSATIYTPLINWPPGYSLLLLPFYVLFGHNYIAAGLTIDIIAAIVLIVVSRKILFLLDIPLHLVNIFTLLVGFFVYRFYFVASTDAIGVSFFLLAIYFMLRLFRDKKSWITKTVLISLFLLLCGSLKYLFIPVLFVVPAFILIRGIADRDALTRKAGIFSLLLLAVVIGALLLYQQSISGMVGYISEQGRGFYPQHLLEAYPFFPGSFIRPDTVSSVAGQSAQTDLAIYRVFLVIHIILLLFIIAYAIKAVRKNGIRNLSLPAVFLYLALSLSLAITFVLAILSMRVPPEEIVPGYFWTYIEESRYYGLATILVHFFIFIFYKHYRQSVSTFTRYLFFALLLLLIPEMIRCGVFGITRIKNLGREEYTWQYEDRFQRYTDKVINDAIRQYGTDKVVATGSNYYMNNRVAVYSHTPLLTNIYAINDLASVKAAAPTILLAVIQESDKPAFQSFLASKQIALAGYFDNYYFYTVRVDANSP
jgi:hypothetical protein